MTEAHAIALAGGIFSAVYAAVQVGDRLWGKPDKESSCDPDVKAQLAATLTSLNQLTATTTALSQAVMQLIADRHAERQLAEARHQELIRVLGRKE